MPKAQPTIDWPRIGKASLLAIPLWVGFSIILSFTSCFVLGPWGGALDHANKENLPDPWLQMALILATIMLSLLVAWRFTGKKNKAEK